MRIRIYPDPILRTRCNPLEVVSPDTRITLMDMAQSMYQAKGIGLAAPQVGLAIQLIVVDTGDGLIALANPRVVKKGGKSILEEGCLSFPGITVKVKRSKTVSVEGLNEEGNLVTIDAEGIKAHALQHEIDHLKGTLIIDYLGWRKRLALRPKLKELTKNRKVK